MVNHGRCVDETYDIRTQYKGQGGRFWKHLSQATESPYLLWNFVVPDLTLVHSALLPICKTPVTSYLSLADTTLPNILAPFGGFDILCIFPNSGVPFFFW